MESHSRPPIFKEQVNNYVADEVHVLVPFKFMDLLRDFGGLVVLYSSTRHGFAVGFWLPRG